MIFGDPNDAPRLRWAFESFRNGAWGAEPDGENDVVCIRAADFDGRLGRLNSGERTLRSIEPNTYDKIALRPGDIVLEKSGGGERQLVGRAVLFDETAPSITSNFLARCRPADGMEPAFVKYLLLAIYEGRGTFPHLKQSTGIQNLDLSSFLNIRVRIPPPETQRRIARFLDEKTARIIGLIAKKRALLDRLAEKRQALITRAVTKGLDPTAPMKPSGIDWLGKIPAHWEVLPLKRLGQVRSGITKGKSYDGEEVLQLPYLRVANVQDGWLDLSEVTEIEVRPADAHKYLLKDGDVLMNEGGDNDKLGRGTVWRNQVFPCMHQNHVFAVRLRECEPDWIARCTEAAYAKFHFFRRAVQSTNLASISKIVVGDLPVPMPSAIERTYVLRHLDESLKLLTDQVDRVGETVSLLDEYRSALITAAVTGQLTVHYGH